MRDETEQLHARVSDLGCRIEIYKPIHTDLQYTLHKPHGVFQRYCINLHKDQREYITGLMCGLE